MRKEVTHPIQKFVAIGKDSNIVLNHTENSIPYSVLNEIIKRGGKNIRIGSLDKVVGVGTTHCAIEELGHKQNILKLGVCYLENGKIKKFYHKWPTGCATAFNKMMPLYKASSSIINEGKVGAAEAILSDMKKTFDLEVLLGREFPNFLRCNDPTCHNCRLNWKGDRHSTFKVIYSCLKERKFRRVGLILFMYLYRNYQPK